MDRLPHSLCNTLLLAMLAAAGGCATPAPGGDVSSPEPGLPDPLIAGWQGASVCERLHEDARQRVLRCTFAPGAGHERHFHRPHFGYVLAGGTMQITDDNGVRVVRLQTGNTWTSAGVAWHEVLNVGDTTSVYLLVEPR